MYEIRSQTQKVAKGNFTKKLELTIFFSNLRTHAKLYLSYIKLKLIDDFSMKHFYSQDTEDLAALELKWNFCNRGISLGSNHDDFEGETGWKGDW